MELCLVVEQLPFPLRTSLLPSPEDICRVYQEALYYRRLLEAANIANDACSDEYVSTKPNPNFDHLHKNAVRKGSIR